MGVLQFCSGAKGMIWPTAGRRPSGRELAHPAWERERKKPGGKSTGEGRSLVSKAGGVDGLIKWLETIREFR
jgi:hypothetical protein